MMAEKFTEELVPSVPIKQHGTLSPECIMAHHEHIEESWISAVKLQRVSSG